MSNKSPLPPSAQRYVKPDTEEAYVSFSDANMPQALAALNGFIDDCEGISSRTVGGINRIDRPNSHTVGVRNVDLSDLQSNISGRPGLSAFDYYNFRPGEKPPTKPKDIMRAVDGVYYSVGLVRNMIDLMADFACKGISIVHPNEKIQKFYQEWFRKVSGDERSERFLNNLYRLGNLIIRKQTAKIKIRKPSSLQSAFGAPDLVLDKDRISKKEIPIKYTFLYPASVDIIEDTLGAFLTKRTYTITLSITFKRLFKQLGRAEQAEAKKTLPSEIVAALESNKNVVVLDPEKTIAYHYKKDDWQTWAHPLLYAVLDDLNILQKLRLADMSALDGAISNLRIFKLGSLEHRIVPTRVAAQKLSEILEANVGGGTIDIVWGPDIELVESKTNIHEFLGEEKYRPHLDAIYAGLGIPPTLTGSVGNSGTTNNLISLKTLMSRLEYGRKRLIEFWNNEIIAVQKAMGFKLPASIEFTIMNLGDEVAEKALLIQMADRNLISDEMIQKLFGNDPDIERVRLNRENVNRFNGKMIPKSGPFHDPQFGLALKKLAFQDGRLNVEHVGLEPDAKILDLRISDDPLPILDEAADPEHTNNDDDQNVGIPGRPKNSKDKKKRKDKTFVPKSRATMELWATNIQTTIAKLLNPHILNTLKKKTLRELTASELAEYDKIKFGVLCNLQPFSEVDLKTLLVMLPNAYVPSTAQIVYNNLVKDMCDELDRCLSHDELKFIRSIVYTHLYNSGDN